MAKSFDWDVVYRKRDSVGPWRYWMSSSSRATAEAVASDEHRKQRGREFKVIEGRGDKVPNMDYVVLAHHGRNRMNPSSYAGDPYWTRARFKGECCKCRGVVRKGDPIYYYPKGKRVYCDGASCGKAANQDFISMRDDEDMYNRRNPSSKRSVVQVRVELPSGQIVLASFDKARWLKATMNQRDLLVSTTFGCRDWKRWDEITSRSNPKRRNPGHGHLPSHAEPAGVRLEYIGGWGDDEYRAWFNGRAIGNGHISPRGGGKENWSFGKYSGIADGQRDAEQKVKLAAMKTMRSRRSNPSLGMPGMPHTWVTASGVKVKAGDTIEYVHKSGPGAPVVRRKKVIKYLVFDDHVMVQSGNNGDLVDDSNFMRVVRRA